MGKTVLYAALKLLFPPVCLHCEDRHDKLASPLCLACVSHLSVRPISSDLIITFEGIGPAQSLMTALKSGATHLPALLAAYMALQYAQSTLPLPDVITAVPTSYWRKWQMGHESAFALARALALLLDRPFLPLLKRQRQMFRQELLTREERAFLPSEEFVWKAKMSLRGKTVLLIDDTITTGATLACCAERLWEASPAKILKMACVDRGYLIMNSL